MAQDEQTQNRRPVVPFAQRLRRATADRIKASAAFQASDDLERPRWAILNLTAFDYFIVFNAAVALTASLWLAASGKWVALGFEMLDVVVAPFLFLVFAIALTPAMFALWARTQALSNGRPLVARLCYWGMHGWTALVVWSWCLVSFRTMPRDFTAGIPWPSLLFAYSMAALPIQWLIRGPWEGEVALWSRLLRRLIRARVQTPRL